MKPANRARLGPHDVVLYAHPGSGTSWISTLLVQLGIFHASGHDEELLDTESQKSRPWPQGDAPTDRPGIARPTLSPEERARHLPLLSDRARRHVRYREPLRVIQTNDSALGWNCERPVVLLVRDGRDVLLSLYHHLRGFGGVQASFEEYLAGGGGAWPPPAHSWAVANSSWLDGVPPERRLVLRFEDCRADPRARFGELLAFLGVARAQAELASAILASSYDAMRSAEERALGEEAARTAARFMRRGRIGDWREAYDARALAHFSGLPRRVLERFGYPAEGIP